MAAMIDVALDEHGGGVVITFRIPKTDHVPVHVVGDFNGWSPTALPMEPDANGELVARIALPRGRRYRFRYFLAESRWENDWAADDYAPNEFGGDDSVIDLTPGGPHWPRSTRTTPDP